ncbi:hypothetical protein AB0N89_00625 [Amycolatopsis sp. NPDC089917]
MSIDHARFLTVPVSDQAKARDFSVGKLGFDLLEAARYGNWPR